MVGGKITGSESTSVRVGDGQAGRNRRRRESGRHGLDIATTRSGSPPVSRSTRGSDVPVGGSYRGSAHPHELPQRRRVGRPTG